MSYLEELLPEFRKGAKIRLADWKPNHYIILKDLWFIDETGKKTDITVGELIANNWEFYQMSGPGWQYIIDHKCLCWFWDADYCKMCNILQKIDTSTAGTKVYIDKNNLRWNNCRPVRRDEVTFYEDKKDE